MSIPSNWKITWDPGGTPALYLDHGQEMDGEIDFPWEQLVEERRVIEGNYTEPLPRNAVRGSITFTSWKVHADDKTARAYLLSHRANLPAGLRKTLRIQPLGGADIDLANSVLVTALGRMIVTPEALAMTSFTYTFAGAW